MTSFETVLKTVLTPFERSQQEGKKEQTVCQNGLFGNLCF